MDDFELWKNSKEKLQDMLHQVEQYAAVNLELTLKTPVLDKATHGLPFLGFLVKSSGIFLLKKSDDWPFKKHRLRIIKGHHRRRQNGSACK